MNSILTDLVDFHCHLDLYKDFKAAVQECEDNRIHTLAVTTTPKAWQGNLKVIGQSKFVRCALGLHPQLVGERANELPIWDSYLEGTRYVGEVGLDSGPRFYKSFDLQKNVFLHILKRCNDVGEKILTVHSVRSTSTVLDMIENNIRRNRCKIVLHWFSGTIKEAQRAKDLGCYFSLNSEMANGNKFVDLLNVLPKNRILTETDGPFLSINNTPARPKDVNLIIKIISEQFRREQLEIQQLVMNNLQQLEG